MMDEFPSAGKGQPLFGREHDLETIARMLYSSECRLVTLVGPGGIGKTCLSLQVAQHLHDDFDQVYFIPLQSITSTQYIVATIAEQLGLRLHSRDNVADQLLRFLKTRHLLLVLDNFEHLLQATSLITSILEQTDHIKLLVTSREVLNIQHEWVWPVRGIAYPEADTAPNPMDYPAVRMFDARARRINPDFSIAQELSPVIQICTLVEGIPLAIELASGWLKSLTCTGILAELRRDIDILSTRMRDVPERHRSMRAVFDRSWRLLATEEQHILMRLSLFRASFTRDASYAVAGASLNFLTTLIDKSLLYHNQDGRYQFHELFRQYAYQQLVANKEAFAQANNALTIYYRDFLAAHIREIWGERQMDSIRQVAAELPNIRMLSDRLTFTDKPASSRRALHTLSEVYQFIGNYREAANLINQVIDQLEEKGEDQLDREEIYLLAEMMNNLGWLYIRLGEFETAAEMIQRSITMYDRHHIKSEIGLASDPRISMSEVHIIQGNIPGARSLSGAAYTDAITNGDLLNASVALYVLSNVELAAGDQAQAEKYIEEAIKHTEKTGNRWFMAYCLNQQGHIYREKFDYANAQHRYEESYHIREAFADPEGQAVALNHLGTLALLQQQHARAIELFDQSLPIYQRIEDRGGLFTALVGLAVAHVAQDQFSKAHDALLQALQIAREVDVTSWWLSLYEAVGEFVAATGDMELGAGLVRLAHQHPESKSITRVRAERWLQRAKPGSTGETTPIDSATQQIENALHSWQALQKSEGAANMQSSLIEPLSEREIEILQLIAEGMTNQEIADYFVLTVGTVKSHNYNLFGKLGVKNRNQAVKRARELKLL